MGEHGVKRGLRVGVHPVVGVVAPVHFALGRDENFLRGHRHGWAEGPDLGRPIVLEGEERMSQSGERLAAGIKCQNANRHLMHVKRVVLCGRLRLVGHRHAVQGVGRQVHPAEGGLVVLLAHSRAGDKALVARIPSCQLHLAPGHTGHEEVGAVDVPVNPGAVSAPPFKTNVRIALVGFAQFLAVVVEEVDHAPHAGSPATLEGGDVGPD